MTTKSYSIDLYPSHGAWEDVIYTQSTSTDAFLAANGHGTEGGVERLVRVTVDLK